MRFLLYAFPIGFRDRYGAELLTLAREGGHPVHDGLNIVLAGLRMRLERLGAFGRPVMSVGVVGAAVGSAAVGGCLVLGSIALGGTGALLAQRVRREAAFAR